MECYYFCQQYEDYFKTFGPTEMNYTPFATSFFCSSISPRSAKHNHRHKNATLIPWLEFKAFF